MDLDFRHVTVHLSDPSIIPEANVAGMLASAKLVSINSMVQRSDDMPCVVMPIMTYAAFDEQFDERIEQAMRWLVGRMMAEVVRSVAGSEGVIVHAGVQMQLSVFPESPIVVLQLVSDMAEGTRYFVLGFEQDLLKLGIVTSSRPSVS